MLHRANRAEITSLFKLRKSVSPGDAKRRAAEGASIMDVLAPGWHHRIRIESLDLYDGASCILGQLHGSFDSGLRHYPVLATDRRCQSAISPVSLGLIARQNVDPALQEQDCEYLTQAWINEIEDRLLRRGAAQPAFAPLGIPFHTN